MFQNAQNVQTLCFNSFLLHSLTTTDKVLSYGENNHFVCSEHPIVVNVERNEESISMRLVEKVTILDEKIVVTFKSGMDMEVEA